VSVANNSLLIETVGLDLTNPDNGRSVYLGRFRVAIPMNGETPTMVNLDNKRQGWEHPHVGDGGYGCFGSSESLLREFVQNREILGLFEFIIFYLETYNPQDSYGRHADWWFRNPMTRPDPNAPQPEPPVNATRADGLCNCAECRRDRGERY
jgi:hypothetical protein